MASFKDGLLKGAMKVMQSERAQKLMTNESVQSAIGKAFQTGFAVKEELDESKQKFAKKLNLATGDDLRTMKRELDRLQRQVTKLKKEKEDLSTELDDKKKKKK